MIYHHFLPIVYRFILAKVGDVPTAEDLTSETFFAMIERIGETRADDVRTFAAWMFGIARNQVGTHFRRQKTRPITHLDAPVEDQLVEPSADTDPVRVITGRESLDELRAALGELTEEQRNILLYRTVGGLSAEDVGRQFHKQAGAVRALQFRALATLGRILRYNLRPTPPPASEHSPKGVGPR